MIAEYYIEIIISIIVISAIIITLLTKRTKKIQTIESIDIAEDVKVDEFNVTTNKETNTTANVKSHSKDNDEVLVGTQEGSFEEESEAPQQKQSKKSHIIAKREVPPHGKIVKSNFKEFAGTRVLVAEDNIINQKVINALLDATGIIVVMANDGQEALDILANDTDFTLILMDAHMPRVDGFEATKIIRETPEYDHILVVALSGDTAADDIAKMSAAGMQEHLEKPLRMDALYDVLYAYTGKETSQDSQTTLKTEELDTDLGLYICSGDKVFYCEILDEFVHSYSSSDKTIVKLINAKQMKEVDRLLLDIIGLSSNIGAHNLESTALNLKNTLLSGKSAEYKTCVSKYSNTLKLLILDIKKYI